MNRSFRSFVLATLLAARAAAADVCSATYQRGLDAFKAEDYASARSEFSHAYDLCHKPRILYAIAQTYRFEMRLEPALEYYEQFLAQSERARTTSDEDLREKARGYVAQLTAGLGGRARCTAVEDRQQLQVAVMALFRLAECHGKVGEFASAWRLFQEAAEQTGTAGDGTSRKLRDLAQARVSELQPRISMLTISVAPRRQLVGLEITRGAERVDAGSWNRPMPVDGGLYTITASAPGTRAWSSQISIAAERDNCTVEVPDLRDLAASSALVPRQVTALAEPPARTVAPAIDHALGSQDRPTTVVPLVVGIGALGLLGGGLALEVGARWRYDDAKAEVTNQARRESLYNSANTARDLAAISVLSGLAAGGVAAWLYLRARPHAHDKPSHGSLRVVPTGAGIAAAGYF